ncbi:glucose-6-phosphate exchanger SLC37A2-like isoform X1 [Montipora capricornis]|uniref:glucose-6-phosphate exchanger SLC37A2-like isoform X1 n=1 Tax=Montipora foliosa TaxID=591990 RepID=UPI0035F19591
MSSTVGLPAHQHQHHHHEHRSKIPYGIRFIQWLGRERTAAYRSWVLILTFFAYTTYHLSRKPISVVKGTLNPNCSKHTQGCHGWAPFDSDSGDELLGALDLAFLFSYAVGMFFSGFVAEHMDLRHFLTIGMISSGMLTIAFGLGYFWNIHSFAYFVTVQIFSGFFQSSGWPSVVECVGNWFGKGRRGLIMGIWNSHTSVGNILGSAIAGIWASHYWGYAFIVPGCIISGMAIIVFLFLVVDPLHVGCPPPQQRSEVPPLPLDASVNRQGYTEVISDDREGFLKDVYISDPTGVKIVRDLDNISSSSQLSSTSTPGDNAHAVGFWSAVLIPGVIEYSLCLFFAKLVSYTFLFWLPFYIAHTSIGGEVYGPTTAADLSTLFDVGGIIGGILAGYISDKTDCSGITVVVMLVFAGPMLFIYRFFANANLKINIILMIITGIFVNGPYALITTAVSANLGTHPCLHGNTKAMATVTAIIDGTGSMGAALGPLLTGIISPTGWNNVFFMLMAADASAAILLSRQVMFELHSKCSSSPRTLLLASSMSDAESGIHTDSNSTNHSRRSAEREPLLQSE